MVNWGTLKENKSVGVARKEGYQVEMSRRSWAHAGRSSVGRENSLWRVRVDSPGGL